MRAPKRRKNHGAGAVLGLAALGGAVLCVSFFSLKAMLCVIAALLIVIGIYLLRL